MKPRQHSQSHGSSNKGEKNLQPLAYSSALYHNSQTARPSWGGRQPYDPSAGAAAARQRRRCQPDPPAPTTSRTGVGDDPVAEMIGSARTTAGDGSGAGRWAIWGMV